MMPNPDKRMGLTRGLVLAVVAGLLAAVWAPGPDSGPGGEAAYGTTMAPGGDLIVPLTTSVSAPVERTTEPLSTVLPPEVEAPVGADAASGWMTTDVLKLGFDTLASFSYCVRVDYPSALGGRPVLVTDDHIPQRIRDLDGVRVALTGYFMPLRMRARGVLEFLLVRDQLACCFGLSPLMNHWVHVVMPRSEQGLDTLQPVIVRGTLQVGELRENGSIVSIYRLEGEQLELVPAGSLPGEPTTTRSDAP